MHDTKQQIQSYLMDDCQLFIDKANSLSEDEFTKHEPERWSVADVMQHLYLSARPVARLMSGPREVLAQWGTPRAPSRTNEEITTAYQNVLAKGVKAPPGVTPRPEDMAVEKAVIVQRFSDVYQAVSDAINGWPEEEFDAYCVPHPAFGTLTVREMLYFTSGHTRHHFRRL